MSRISKIFIPLFEYLIYIYFRMKWQFTYKKIRAQKLKREKPRLLFASTPIISYPFWARSMAEIGYQSKCLTFAVPVINSKSDYDLFFNDIYPIPANAGQLKQLIQKFKVFTYSVKNYDILFTSFRFQFLSQTRFWKKEAFLLKFFGLKTVVTPYGNDFYMYSKIIDHSGKHNMLVNNPQEALNEELISERAIYWKNNADFMIMGFMLDGAQRWDALPVSVIHLDTREWTPKKSYTNNDGKNGVVKIAHTPNHRGIKGTEFIIAAVNELKKEGLNAELVLIEGKPNHEVKRILQEEADIHVEQIIFNGYALSGMEGMACGLPVLSNISREDITRVFRRYSYLNECPIISTTPENIKDNLKLLITKPDLRKELGEACRSYVVKYHSYQASQFMFESIIDKIWYNKTLNMMNLYHPLDPNSFNNKTELVKNPLFENKFVK